MTLTLALIREKTIFGNNGEILDMSAPEKRGDFLGKKPKNRKKKTLEGRGVV